MSSTVANGTSRAGIDAAAASLMVLLTLSWGLNYVAAKVSYAGYDPAGGWRPCGRAVRT